MDRRVLGVSTTDIPDKSGKFEVKALPALLDAAGNESILFMLDVFQDECIVRVDRKTYHSVCVFMPDGISLSLLMLVFDFTDSNVINNQTCTLGGKPNRTTSLSPGLYRSVHSRYNARKGL